MRDVEPSKAYLLLEPGPIVLVTTAHEGRANVMTMGFHKQPIKTLILTTAI